MGYHKDKKETGSKGSRFIEVEQRVFQKKMKLLIAKIEGQGKWSKGLYQKIQDIN